jgi:ureidoglycolate lyase
MPPITIPIEPLTPRAFAPFGQVIQNPARTGDPATGEAANQGTAVKYPDISPLASRYHLAPSRRPARPALTLFACAPRALRAEGRAAVLDVPVLERHPYTTQTFVPLGVAAPRDRRAGCCYVVVVAPERRDEGRRGRPDVPRARAFAARGDQAVTYAAGTWHAPMAVVGRRAVDFVVCQFVNGDEGEDCEEVAVVERLAVDVGGVGARLARL